MVPIGRVTESDLAALLPLVRAYCDFYGVAPSRGARRAPGRRRGAEPQGEGVPQHAPDEAGRPAGFATVYWSWDTLVAARVGVMHDLFVTPEQRGRGIAEALIGACRAECRDHDAVKLGWQTARDNDRARRLYERVGAIEDQWIDYWLPAGDGDARE